MKYAFIINPVSGNGKKAAELIAKLDEFIRNDDRDIRYYVTEGAGDATVIANRLAYDAEDMGEAITIFACGGDGTNNEVVNGIDGYDNVTFGVVPVGSGNDFVRNFEGADFMDIEKQLSSSAEKVDVIRYSYAAEDGVVDRYCANGMNIGFDGNTAILANELKSHKFINGSFSYLLAVAITLIKKEGAKLRITADGEVVHEGNLILSSVSNGRFCGGGIELCPKAEVNNGKLELLIVSDITRRKFIQVFPGILKGKILDIPDLDNFATFAQPEHITIEPLEGEMKFVVDGEEKRTGSLEIDIIRDGLNFVVPR